MNNPYRISTDGSYCEIYFRDGSFFIIDTEDLPIVQKASWHKGKRGYPTASTSRRSKEGRHMRPVHRWLIQPPKGYDIDHINGDKMDNRRKNLRVCTHQENSFNQKLRCTNTSGYYGVSYMKNCGKYEAYINLDGKKIYLGIFQTADDAAHARDVACRKIFGEYARLNCDLEKQRALA